MAPYSLLPSPLAGEGGDEGDNRLLDSGSQLHFDLVAVVGQAGLYAGAHRGGVGIRGARHPVLLRQRQ